MLVNQESETFTRGVKKQKKKIQNFQKLNLQKPKTWLIDRIDLSPRPTNMVFWSKDTEM